MDGKMTVAARMRLHLIEKQKVEVGRKTLCVITSGRNSLFSMPSDSRWLR